MVRWHPPIPGKLQAVIMNDVSTAASSPAKTPSGFSFVLMALTASGPDLGSLEPAHAAGGLLLAEQGNTTLSGGIAAPGPTTQCLPSTDPAPTLVGFRVMNPRGYWPWSLPAWHDMGDTPLDASRAQSLPREIKSNPDRWGVSMSTFLPTFMPRAR